MASRGIQSKFVRIQELKKLMNYDSKGDTDAVKNEKGKVIEKMKCSIPKEVQKLHGEVIDQETGEVAHQWLITLAYLQLPDLVKKSTGVTAKSLFEDAAKKLNEKEAAQLQALLKKANMIAA